ncbi:MAG TPA: hypothetical protein DDY78_07890 [Planctomycetales bacterium]|jgi:hypothetical protein|nr:hypothetical protein [Planctomycetales bacterium]
MSSLQHVKPTVVDAAPARENDSAIVADLPAAGVPPPDPAEVVAVRPSAFLRSMAAIAWSAFRHPRLTTEIDLTTGEIVRHY